jgi:non-specific protein-tyrosine kinase
MNIIRLAWSDPANLTTINLALSFAKEYDQTALLVDCDLKQQSVHKILGIESKHGLVDYLVNGTDLSQLIMWPGIEKFTLVSGGRPLTDSSELLGSPRMRELITEMKDRCTDRYVIFDVPPVLVAPMRWHSGPWWTPSSWWWKPGRPAFKM